MIAITIAIGDLYKQFAITSVPLAKKMTGLNVKVITENDNITEEELKCPYLIKSRLFDFVEEDHILYFDADLFYIRPWDPLEFCDTKFYCVRDHTDGYTTLSDSYFFNLDNKQYFNSGFFIANRYKHKAFFEKTYEICKAFNNFKKIINKNLNINTRITPTYDQSIFNLVAQKINLPINFLSKRYNWLTEYINSNSLFLKTDSLSIHYCSGKDAAWSSNYLKFITEHVKNKVPIKWDEKSSQNCVGKYIYKCAKNTWAKEIFLHSDGLITSDENLQWEKYFCINEYDKTLIFFGKEEIENTKDKTYALSASFYFKNDRWIGKFSENRVNTSPIIELIKLD